MISAGKTAEIKVGRQILCKEKPGTRVKSTCAKNLAKTVKAAKKGLTTKQQKLWRKYVYTSALLQAKRFCNVESKKPIIVMMAAEPQPKIPSTSERYKTCTNKVLTGKTKFKGLFGKKFKWGNYLVKGAKIIKKLPMDPPDIDGKTNPNE